MRDYFLLARLQPGSLFYFQSERYLTRGVVSHLLQDSARFAGLPYQCLKGHSFRIGAASVAAAAGLPDWLIKVLAGFPTVTSFISELHSQSCTQLPQNWRLFRAILPLIELKFFLSFAWGDALSCMHLWRLSLRSGFPQACSRLGFCLSPANRYSCPIQHVLSSIQLVVLERLVRLFLSRNRKSH